MNNFTTSLLRLDPAQEQEIAAMLESALRSVGLQAQAYAMIKAPAGATRVAVSIPLEAGSLAHVAQLVDSACSDDVELHGVDWRVMYYDVTLIVHQPAVVQAVRS